MIVAAAQTIPHRLDIVKNLEDHYRFIKIAAENGAQLLVFPELSITGYEREYARQISFTPEDARLDKLRDLAAVHNIIIIAGAPVQIDNLLYLGAFIMTPDKKILLYTKQFLHSGEEHYFASSFTNNPLLQLEDETISLAICFDINNPQHAENAAKVNTTLYVAGIFFTPAGITNAHNMLGGYAKTHHMAVLMSNYGGPSWNMEGGGQCAFWNNSGALVAQIPDAGEGLIVAEKENSKWTGRVITNVK